MKLGKTNIQFSECHPVYTIQITVVLWINNLPSLYLLAFINLNACKVFTWIHLVSYYQGESSSF